MCIIIAKPEGVKCPSYNTLKKAFHYNNDGAGLMLYRNNFVQILKGFFEWKTYKKAIKSLKITKEDCVVYHMRIATKGEIVAKNCHPFPISTNVEELEATEIKTNAGFAHNGTFPIKAKDGSDCSDSQLFVSNILFQIYPKIKSSEGIQKLYEMGVSDNKTVILDSDGIQMFGWGWKNENGVYYSNTKFKDKVKTKYKNPSYKMKYYQPVAPKSRKVNISGTTSLIKRTEEDWIEEYIEQKYGKKEEENALANVNFYEMKCLVCDEICDEEWWFCPNCGQELDKNFQE